MNVMMGTEVEQRASILATQTVGHSGSFQLLSVQEPRFNCSSPIEKQSPLERHRASFRQQAEY